MQTITLITCTGGRPEVFALCQKYIVRQTLKAPIQWIVVKDTEEEVQPIDSLLRTKHINFELFQGPKFWREGINTQRPNMDEALKHVKGDYIFVIEDDDYYREDYLEKQLYFLQRFDVVGQCNSRYYNVKERLHREWMNYTHASLCETGMVASKLDLLDRAVNSGQLFMDIALWEIVRNERHNHLLYNHIGIVTGMKGLPGKRGIGSGHFPDKTFTRDPMFAKLREWIGEEDTKIYVDLIMRNR